jgi:hypothetical protein
MVGMEREIDLDAGRPDDCRVIGFTNFSAVCAPAWEDCNPTLSPKPGDKGEAPGGG